jgi:hypothetical protein
VSANEKKFILCNTDAFTKYVQLVALANKEAITVSTAIFNHWIFHFGMPVNLITDQGKEFCAGISEELFKHLGTSHLQTTAGQPS